jgi:uncharacterized membrane protein YeiH
MSIFYSLDLIGTMAFAISGVLTGYHKRLDPFGLYIIAFVTAAGGGTLRDILIGRTPVGWMRDLNYIYIITFGFIVALIFRKTLEKMRTSLFLFDSTGLGIFTLIGLEKGLELNLHPVLCIILGAMTACFGGVVRDTLCNEIPVIFRKEIYATICIFGGLVFFALRYYNLPDNIVYIVTAATIIIIRLIAVRFKWSLQAFGDGD